jgi:hypothetical protein
VAEGLGRPAGPGQRPHGEELAGLAQRGVGGGPAGVLDGGVERSGVEQHVGELVDQGGAPLGERHRLDGEGSDVGELAQRLAPPQRQRLAQRFDGGPRTVGGPGSRRLGRGRPDPVDVQLVTVEQQPVPGALAGQPVGERPEVAPEP